MKSYHFAQFMDKELGIGELLMVYNTTTKWLDVTWLLSLIVILLMMGQKDGRARERQTKKPRSSLWCKVRVNSRGLNGNRLLIGLFVPKAI